MAKSAGDATASLRWCLPVGDAREAVCDYIWGKKWRTGFHSHRPFHQYIWSVFSSSTINSSRLLPMPAVSRFGTHLGGTATGNIVDDRDACHVTMVMMVVKAFAGGKAYLAHFCPGPMFMRRSGPAKSSG